MWVALLKVISNQISPSELLVVNDDEKITAGPFIPEAAGGRAFFCCHQRWVTMMMMMI